MFLKAVLSKKNRGNSPSPGIRRFLQRRHKDHDGSDDDSATSASAASGASTRSNSPEPDLETKKSIATAVSRWSSTADASLLGSSPRTKDSFVVTKAVSKTVFFASKFETFDNVEGTFAHAQKYEHLKVVVKTDPTSSALRKPKGSILRELRVLQELNHPFIPKFIGYHVEGFAGILVPCIVLEYTEGIDLFEFLLDHELLPLNFVRSVFGRIVAGITYVHQNGIFHRDLKPENIIYMPLTETIKIIDWKFSNKLTDEIGPEARGSLHYVAPETFAPLSADVVIAPVNDIWSLGVLLYVMLSKYFPFDGLLPQDILEAEELFIVNYDRVSLPESVKSLLKGMLCFHKHRLGLQDIAMHPWMQSTEEERFGGLKKIEVFVERRTLFSAFGGKVNFRNLLWSKDQSKFLSSFLPLAEK